MRRTVALMVFGVLISMGIAACTTRTPDASKNARHQAVLPLGVTVPPGTYMTVVLQDGISTDKSTPGDSFSAILGKDVIVDGLTVFQKGSTVHGRVVDVQEPGRVKGLAQLKLVLTSVEHNGTVVPIQTQMYVGIARNAKKHDAEIANGSDGTEAAIGTIAGDGNGEDAILATNGEQLDYPPETRLLFTLASPVEV